MDNCGTKTQYQYDALGRRIKKTSAEQETEFLWDGDVLLSETHHGKNAEQKELLNVKIYVFEPNTFKPLAQIQNNEIYHYHLDHLGTPQELTNNRGDIVWSARYKTYGNLALKDVDDVENNLRFQGQYFDQETGLHYNRHRYYNPNTGQFTQQDPIGLLGGLNNYQYANNPIQWVDPLGLSCKELALDDIDPTLARHLKSLPGGSYEILEEVDRPGQGFTGDKAVKIKLLDTIEGHRFSGGASNPAGPYVAIGEMPASRNDTRQLLALKSFGRGAYNDMTHYTSVTMEKGAILYVGEVAPQTSKAGRHYKGDGTQVFAEFCKPEEEVWQEVQKVRVKDTRLLIRIATMSMHSLLAMNWLVFFLMGKS